MESLKKCKIFIVAVPIPIDTNKKPNLENLITATNLISRIVKKKDIIIYESTVFPGATEEISWFNFKKKLISKN